MKQSADLNIDISSFVSTIYYFLIILQSTWNWPLAYHISTPSITYGKRIDLEIIHGVIRPILGARATGYHQISMLICINLHEFVLGRQKFKQLIEFIASHVELSLLHWTDLVNDKFSPMNAFHIGEIFIGEI